jgi:hypothetical protein
LKLLPPLSRKNFLVGGFAALLIATCVWYVVRPAPPSPSALENEAGCFRPPGEPDQPYRQMSPDHQIDRIQHKDANGQSPLELVQTPHGTVTIKRTFSTAGALLKEEAFLNGEKVAVPRR